MDSAPVQSRLSIRRLLLVVVFLLGICVVLLGDIVDATWGFDTMIGGIGKLVGGTTALGALLALYDSVSPIAD